MQPTRAVATSLPRDIQLRISGVISCCFGCFSTSTCWVDCPQWPRVFWRHLLIPSRNLSQPLVSIPQGIRCHTTLPTELSAQPDSLPRSHPARMRPVQSVRDVPGLYPNERPLPPGVPLCKYFAFRYLRFPFLQNPHNKGLKSQNPENKAVGSRWLSVVRNSINRK